jgi:hypothetical protein
MMDSAGCEACRGGDVFPQVALSKLPNQTNPSQIKSNQTKSAQVNQGKSSLSREAQ